MRSFVVLLTAAVFLIGLGHLAILPPFEGLDETAHYSSIRQITATNTVPVLGHSFISPDVIDYRLHGPMPYDAPISHTTRPVSYGQDKTITYADFFAAPGLTSDYLKMYRAAMPRLPYTDITEEFNWEAQHPPLYYLLMAPLMKATDALPFVTQFFVLRLASFLLAFAGFAIALCATLGYAGDDLPKRTVAAGFLVYLLVAPMFYPEFGRLGNDSLCLFLFGAIWALTLLYLRGKPKDIHAVLLGACFGSGLLTKAIFVPVLAGFCMLALIRLWHERRRPPFTARLRGIILVVALALLIGGWWYIVQYKMTGSLVGSLDEATLRHQGGLLASLRGKFSLRDFLGDIVQVARTWSWSGTASSASIAPLLHAPLLLFAAWIGVSYLRELKSRPVASMAWLPVWFAIPFLAGLIWHILLCEASGSNITPGWYLSVLSPALALAAAYGLRRLAGDSGNRILLGAFPIYAVVFLAAVFWAQAALYAGCAVKGPKPDILYKFGDPLFCLDQWRPIAGNLSILGRSYAAAAAFGAGFLCLLSSLFMARGFLKPETVSRT